MADDTTKRPRGWIRRNNRPIPEDITCLPDGTAVKFEPDIDAEHQYYCDLWGADPQAFIRDGFEWGRPYSIVRNRQGPYDFQATIAEDVSKRLQIDPSIYRLGIASGKGIGKTAFYCQMALWHLMTHRHSQTVLLSVTGDQLDQTIWREMGIWFELCKLRKYFKRYRGGRIVHAYQDTWQMFYQTWSQSHLESLHGKHAEYLAFFVDEACGVPNEVLETVESGAVDDHVTLCYFSNPTRLRSRFRQCFEGGTLAHLWQTWQIDSRTTERHNPARVQELLEEIGGDEDDPRFRVNVRGLFPLTDSEQFIPTWMIEDAQKRSPGAYWEAQAYIGVDIARKGTNKTVFCLRQGNVMLDKKVLSQLDAPQCARALIDFINKHRDLKPEVYVDADGYGDGVCDIFQEFSTYPIHRLHSGSNAVGPHAERYENRRMELWDVLKDALRDKLCVSPRDAVLIRQLTTPSAFVNTKGLLQLESKADMQSRGEESPDEADALVYSYGGYGVRKRQGQIFDIHI